MNVDTQVTKANKQLEVYYNSACPACDAGIQYQKNRLNSSRSDANSVDWCDIAQRAEYCDDIKAEPSHVRKYLHLRDQSGQVHIGIEAFIALWDLSDKDRWLAQVFRLPLIKPLAKVAYALFANALYAYNRLRGRW